VKLRSVAGESFREFHKRPAAESSAWSDILLHKFAVYMSIALWVMTAQGCSLIVANGGKKVDDLFKPGTPRSHIEASLGDRTRRIVVYRLSST
tara:strand:- start:128 stop:406 length:279 start_codon:yes stop_codon:yes gene_type:complete